MDAVLGVLALVPIEAGASVAMKRELIVGRIAQRFGLRPELVWSRLEEVRKAAKVRTEEATKAETAIDSKTAPAEPLERELLEVLLADPQRVAERGTRWPLGNQSSWASPFAFRPVRFDGRGGSSGFGCLATADRRPPPVGRLRTPHARRGTQTRGSRRVAEANTRRLRGATHETCVPRVADKTLGGERSRCGGGSVAAVAAAICHAADLSHGGAVDRDGRFGSGRLRPMVRFA